MARARFDPHLHAAPSSRPRWGTDLDVVDAAARHGVRGFVLKSHHESTASRALVATQYAERRGLDCHVRGSIVLNPWTSLVELERALDLGIRVVWWPTLDEDGETGGLRLPRGHDDALRLLDGRTGVTVATGHLAPEPALALVEAAVARDLSVVATHPLNPDIGVGVAAGRRLAGAGAIVEIDARSLRLRRERGTDPAPLVAELLADAQRAYACSDGGQAETGDPFTFLDVELEALVRAGLDREVGRLVAGADAWLEVGAHA